MNEALTDEDLTWLARKISEVRADLRANPRWHRRLELFIDGLIWAYSVDGFDGERVVQDGRIPAGSRLKEAHFRHVPCTDAARRALGRGDLKSVKREHIVPRNVLRRSVLKLDTPEDTKRVLDTYARVALVDAEEEGRLGVSEMPRGWDKDVDWSKPPTHLPSAWARYQELTDPPVVPRFGDGRIAWDEPATGST
jgi:hypothetical protein